jgi:hypothetical protein
LEVANNAEGSAETENQKYVDSIEGKVNVIKASAQEISTTTFDTEFIKDFLDGINQLINKANRLVDLFGAIPVLIASIGSAYGLMNKKFGTLGFTDEFFKNIKKSSTPLNNYSDKISQIQNGFNNINNVSLKNVTSSVEIITKTLNTSFIKNIGNALSTLFKKFDTLVSKSLTSSKFISSNLSSSMDSASIINTKDYKQAITNYNNTLKNNGDMSKYIKEVSNANTVLENYLATRAKINAQATNQTYMEFLQTSNYGKGLSGTLTALSEYNKLADENSLKLNVANDTQKEFLNTLALSNPKLAEQLQSLNKAQVGLVGYATKLAVAKLGTVALSVVSGILNAVVGGLFSYAISHIVSTLVSWAKGLGKVSDETIEASSNLKTFNDELEENISNLKELKEAQEDYANSGDTENLVDTNKQLLELQQTLIDTYGTQADGVDLVNGKLDEQLEKLQEISALESSKFVQENSKDIQTAYQKMYDPSKIFSSTSISLRRNNFSTEVSNILKNNGFKAESLNDLSMTYTYGITNDGSIYQYKKDLQKAYDDVKAYGTQTGEDVSKVLTTIQKKISKYSSDTYDDYETTISSFLDSFVDYSTDDIDGKTLSEWKSSVESLISEYNDYIANGETEKATSTYEEIESLYNMLMSKSDVLNSLKDTITGIETKGLSDTVESWFDGFLTNFNEDVIKTKIENIFSKIDLNKLIGTATASEIVLDFQTGDYKNKAQSYANIFEYMQSVADDCGISFENLIEYLEEFGYISEDTSEHTFNVSSAIENISQTTTELIEALGGSSDELETLADNLDLITDAYSEMSEQGKLTSETILSLISNGYSEALNYNSNADVYNLDREALEKLIQAKYNDQKATLLTQKAELERAKESDLKDIASQSNPTIQAMLQVKFDNLGYDEALNEINTDLYALEQEYKSFEDEISPTKIGSDMITSLSSEFSEISTMMETIRKGGSLSSEDITKLIESDFDDILELDKESGLVTINTEKYEELAQAKIEAYKVDSQNAINSLKEEQTQLISTINEYKQKLSDSTVSTADKSYASQQVQELSKALDENSQSLEDNEYILSMWEDLSSRVGSVANGSFSDILSATKNIESSASTMSNAFKEVKDNGYLSLSTMTSLIDSGYAQCIQLDKTTGKLTLNANSYKQLAEAEIDEQLVNLQSIVSRGQATEQIYAQIQALQLLKNNLAMVTTGNYGSDTDYYKAEAEEQFAYLEHLHNMNVIDDANYYKYLNELNQEYYANKIEYLDDYRKYEEEVYKGLLDAQKELLESQKEALEETKEYWNAQKDALDDEIDAIENQKDYWNDQIDLIEDQKEAIEKQKDAIQDQIDLLEEKNEEEERALKIQEAQIRLQNALNQKTIRVFTEELGWQWETDKDEIKEAQQELDELLQEEEIAQLEKQIDALDDQIDALDDQIDGINDIIDGLDDQIDVLKDQQDAIDKEIDAIDKQEEALDKQISALEEQMNSTHTDELTGLTNSVNEFTKLTQESINKILGLPEDFNTSLTTTVAEPVNNLKNSVDVTNEALTDLKNSSALSNGLLKSSTQVAQTLTINIDKVATDNPTQFIDQLTTLLKENL